MYLYSGNCRKCVCGIKTDMKDIHGKELFTGDIVLLFNPNYTTAHLTAVVSDQFTNYSDGTHIQHESHSPYIMGISDVKLEDSDWIVLKIKKWSDCIDGEHWKEFGFNYRDR